VSNINLDAKDLRERLYRAWMKNGNIPHDKLAEKIGISPFTLRSFLNDRSSRYTVTMRLKLLKWIEHEEAL